MKSKLNVGIKKQAPSFSKLNCLFGGINKKRNEHEGNNAATSEFKNAAITLHLRTCKNCNEQKMNRNPVSVINIAAVAKQK